MEYIRSNGVERRPEDPHIRFHSARRGYVHCHLTPERWLASFRTVAFVTQPGAPIQTAARFTIESGPRGGQPGWTSDYLTST